MISVRLKSIAACAGVVALLAACSNANVTGTSSSVSAVTKPTVTLSVDHSSIDAGTSAMLNWSSTQAATCTATGGWSGTVQVSGTQAITPAQTTTYSIDCTGGGVTTSASATVSVTAPTGAVTPPTVTLTADHASIGTGGSASLTWSSSQGSTCAAAGGWSGAVGTSGSKSVSPTQTTTYTINCTGSGVTASASTTVNVSARANANAVQRPSYNTGSGFFVLNGKLYDPDGLEFMLRGVNRNHYDSDSEAGIVKSGANAARVFVTTKFGKSWPGLAAILQNEHIAHQEVAIPANAAHSTCSNDPATLTASVNDWVNSASVWKTLDRNMILNIANEWGPSNSTVWRDSYISAVKALRAAGYTSTLMIDSGQCGQDMNDLLNYATDVFNADPQKNIVFSLHLYGLTPTASVAGNFAKLHALAQSAGMAFVIGEFGPGRNIGPSPTLTTPGQVISAAEANNIGWLAWAWDDNNLGSCKANDVWFSMTYSCGRYTQTSDLTTFGKDVVLNATYGLQVLAQKPNW